MDRSAWCLRVLLAYALPWLLVSVHLGIDHHHWSSASDRADPGSPDHHHPASDAPDRSHSFQDHKAIAIVKAGAIRLCAADPVFAAWLPASESEGSAPDSCSLPGPSSHRCRSHATSPRHCRAPPRA